MHIGFAAPEPIEPLVDAFVELFRHYAGDQAPARAAVRANLVDGLFGPDTGVRVVQVLDGEQVAALATVSLLYPAPGAKGQLFMKDLFVRAAWRGQGLGEALMRWLARYAVEQGCVRFDWTTETGNPAAIAFYEQLGAARVTEKVYFRLADEALQSFAA